MHRVFALAVVVPFLVLAVAQSVRATRVPVTACGQTVSGNAELVADLDCSAFGGGDTAVILTSGVLYLNGFTLTSASLAAVQCDAACRIVGPGVITGPGNGVLGFNAVFARDLTLTGLGFAAVGAAQVRLRDLTVTGNGNGVGGSLATRVARSTITDNLGFGISGARMTVRDSTVVDNGLDAPGCTYPDLCVDVVSALRPHLLRTTCGHSANPSVAGHPSWGVCQAD